MKHKCKNCAYFIKAIRVQGCGLYYPTAKCSGNLEIECEDFITPEAEKARQEKLLSKKNQSILTRMKKMFKRG